MIERDNIHQPEHINHEPNPYLEYEGKPVILGDISTIDESVFKRSEDGSVVIRVDDKEVRVPVERQVDLAEQTMHGLTEDLQPGSSLGDEFMSEAWAQYEEALMEDPEHPSFGTGVYYPQFEQLVTFAPQKWHEIALLARNSLLIQDLEQQVTFEEQRKIFSDLTIGVAGASVGKNAFSRVIDTIRPDAIKIADPSAYKVTNINRTELDYWDIGVNKSVVAARQAHRKNPFIDISVYSEGIHPNNIQDFISGNNSVNEPGIDVLIEETDDPFTKMSLRLLAKEHHIPLYLITDIGTAYQIDFRNFRDDPDQTLTFGVSDDELLTAFDTWQNDMANRELFFDFAWKLIGEHWRSVPEFRDLTLKKMQSDFSGGIPQLGAAAHRGGAQAALLIAEHALGHHHPERIFNHSDRTLIREGNHS